MEVIDLKIEDLKECRSMMQLLPIGIYKMSASGEFLKSNGFLLKMFGYESFDLFSKNVNFKNLFSNEESNSKFTSDLESNNKSLENYEVKLKLPKSREKIGCLPAGREGSEIWVALTASLNKDGTIQGTMMCVTERKNMEYKIKLAKEKETSRLKDISNKAKKMIEKVVA